MSAHHISDEQFKLADNLAAWEASEELKTLKW
jgi:hypothetical protein